MPVMHYASRGPSRFRPDTAVRPPDWRRDARCGSGERPDRWHEEGENAASVLQAEEAKQICGGCPVWRECLDDALARGEKFGIWGGLDTDEREALLRESRARRSGRGVAREAADGGRAPAV